ncbi:MAG TPA: hypothetical protein VM450_05270 [Thermomicrobiales bacterium]|nr:hypothetical protein [Thermomicrobiales bacterium]
MEFADLMTTKALVALLLATLLLALVVMEAFDSGVVEEDAADLFRAGERHDRAINRS